MHVDTYLHGGARREDAPAELVDFLGHHKCPSVKREKARLRTAMLDVLRSQGWTNRMRLDPSSSMSITASRDGSALCLQTGNVSRTYADLLKLQLLYNRGKIQRGVVVVFRREHAKRLGVNLATYERLVREVTVFHSIITIPLIILGL